MTEWLDNYASINNTLQQQSELLNYMQCLNIDFMDQYEPFIKNHISTVTQHNKSLIEQCTT